MTEQFSADVLATEADLPCYFVFKGKQYVGQKTQSLESLTMQDAGYFANYAFDLTVRLAQFASGQPQVNEDFTIEHKGYRVARITPSQDGVMATYAMVQPG